jgi:hypothetical protein
MLYYRMMTLGIILDWKDTAIFKAWFTWWVDGWAGEEGWGRDKGHKGGRR